MAQGYDEERDITDHAGWLQMGKIARETQEALEKKAEIKLTRININENARSPPDWDRFKTLVEGEHGKWYSNLPVDDFKALMEIYEQTPHGELNLDSVRFVFKIDGRIYTEWCMSDDEGRAAQRKNWHAHAEYQGEGFTSFIDNEVHYELERQRSEGDRGSHEGYLRARQRVLGGLTLRAIELFSDWNCGPHPLSREEKDGRGFSKYICTDPRNLRADLEDYIARYDSLRQSQPQAA